MASSQSIGDLTNTEGVGYFLNVFRRTGRQPSFARLAGALKAHGLQGIRHLPFYDLLVSIGVLILGKSAPCKPSAPLKDI
eukprot:257645-Prorocentrum_minimum.AAC.3